MERCLGASKSNFSVSACKILIIGSLILSSQSARGESLGKLESFQKQGADTVKAAGELSEDMIALDFLAGKLRQSLWLDFYPNKAGQMSSDGFRPRFYFRPDYLIAPGQLALAPTREVRKQKASSTSSSCDEVLNPPLPLFNLPTGNSVYCLDNAESSPNLEVDGSGLASLQKSTELSSPSEIQVGYMSVPAKFPDDYFNNPNSQIPRNLDSFKSKRVQLLKFIPFENEPNRVEFIEAKVGGLTAKIPYPEPAFLPPRCEVRLDTPASPLCVSEFPGVPCIDSDSAQFSLVNTSGVVISASFNDVDLEDNEIPQQKVQEVKNELLKTITLSGLRNRMTDTIPEQNNPHFSQGLVTISGVVNGPVTSFNPTECQTSIAVRAPTSPGTVPGETPSPTPDPLNCALTVQRDGATQYCDIRAYGIGNAPPTLRRGSSLVSGLNWTQASPDTFQTKTLCPLDQDSSFTVSSTAPGVNRTCKLGIRRWKRRIGNGTNAHFGATAIPGRNLNVHTAAAASVECEARSWQRIAFENGFRRYDYPAGGWRALCTHADGRTNYTSCGDNRHRAWINNSWGFRPACGEAWTIYLTVYDPLVPNFEVP